MAYLLDTNVISELRKYEKRLAAPGILAWVPTVRPEDLYISVITIEELEIGVLNIERRDGAQGRVLRLWLEEKVLPTFAGRVLPVDTIVARRSAGLHVPDPRPIRDSLIAATALVHGLTVATRNVGDFRLTGVHLFNPWEFCS